MSDALRWARRWARRPAASEHELLDLARTATLEQVRAAYHQLARFAHPDLHRGHLAPAQLEELTIAFARITDSYARWSQRLRNPVAAAAAPAVAPAPAKPASPPVAAMTSPSGALPIGPANAMSVKALQHYRRAEMCLRRGRRVEAMLYLRLAVVTDPHSSFLRKALDDMAG